jgi:NADH-quinone oxidoreductase subunit J
MQDFLFYFFAALTLFCGFLVVANPFSRNPVTMAGLFVLLHAFFLAAVQVLVYAGAVMVLFLFVIMLLDINAETRRKFSRFGVITGALSVLALGGLTVFTIARSGLGAGRTAQVEGATKPLGTMLFTEYLLPFEIVSLLLLVAMVGVILLSKKDLP